MKEAEKKLLDEAIHQQELGNFPQAKKICADILERDPTNVFALHLIGMIYGRLGDIPKAIENLEKALSINPQSPVLHNHLANLLAKSNNVAAAIKHYRKALQIDSQYFDAHQNLGLLFLKQGQLNQAKKEFKNVLHILPDYFPARFYFATKGSPHFTDTLEAVRLCGRCPTPGISAAEASILCGKPLTRAIFNSICSPQEVKK